MQQYYTKSNIFKHTSKIGKIQKARLVSHENGEETSKQYTYLNRTTLVKTFLPRRGFD